MKFFHFLEHCSVFLVAFSIWGADRTPMKFYVDATHGNDHAEGISPETAWKTLDKVNQFRLVPGDQVLFKKGEIWRGQLIPQSGTPKARIIYGTFGKGEKPILQQSHARNRVTDWKEISPGIWTTQKAGPKLLAQIYDCEDSRWTGSFQEGAQGTVKRAVEDNFWFNRVICKKSGKVRHHFQLWGPGLRDLPPCAVLKLKVRSTIPFILSNVEMRMNCPPWIQGMRGTFLNKTSANIDKEWKTISILLTRTNEVDLPFLHISLGGILPKGAVFDFSPIEIWHATIGENKPLTKDIGILILNHGEKYGVKKWKAEDLNAPLDYWYDATHCQIRVKSEQNPAQIFSSIELAQTANIVDQSNRHDITYDGLMLRYTGAHGFGGANTKNITIRNCDLCWIGGGLHFFRKDGEPIRYGSAIEFWDTAENHLVERNRIWEVYDAALTNQGKGEDAVQRNITYRDNVIWNAEYSFEYWNSSHSAVIEKILFEHNTCINSGFGWSHTQRSEPNAAHLLFYHNGAKTSDFVIQNNIFVGTAGYCIRMWNDWSKDLTMRNNLYFSEAPILWRKFQVPHADCAKNQRDICLETNSTFAKPEFVQAAGHDYRLKDSSIGTQLATDGGVIGARIPQPDLTQKEE